MTDSATPSRSDERAMRKAARKRQNEKQIPYAEALRQVRDDYSRGNPRHLVAVFESNASINERVSAFHHPRFPRSTHDFGGRAVYLESGPTNFKEEAYERTPEMDARNRVFIYGEHKSGATLYASQIAPSVRAANLDHDQILMAVDEPRMWTHLTGTYCDGEGGIFQQLSSRTKMIVMDSASATISASELENYLRDDVSVVYVHTNHEGHPGQDAPFLRGLKADGWDIVNTIKGKAETP